MAIPNQVVPDGLTQPYVNQANFGQIVGRINGYATHLSASHVQNVVNNVVRRVWDRRTWYGNFVKGQIISPGFYSTGSVSMTAGSTSVQGTGTAWTTAMVGQQFRWSFIAPIYTIVAVDPVAQVLTLELPWGLPNQSSGGYWITKYYYSFPNIRSFYSVKNLQMMYRMVTGAPQALLENWDPSRLQLFYPRIVATMPPTPRGEFSVELWPAPSTPQAFPYLAETIPPNMVEDSDNLPAFIRSDIVEQYAISEVLLYKTKANVNYSEAMCLQLSKEFQGRAEANLQSAIEVDEGLMRRDVLSQWESMPYPNINWETGDYMGGGDFLRAMSPVAADYY